MKIVVATDTYIPQTNGVVTYLRQVLPLLAKKHQITLFAPGKKKEEEGGRYKVVRFPSLPFPFYEGYEMALPNPLIKKRLEEEEPDIVHCHAPADLGVQTLLMAKKIGVPVVITHHTHLTEYLHYILKEGKLKEIGKKAVEAAMKKVYNKAHLVITPSHIIKEELEKIGVENVITIHNGIKKMERDERRAEEFRKKYNIKGKFVLYLGRVTKEKSVEELVEALEGLPLVVAGSGPLLETLQKSKPYAIYTGYLTEEEVVGAYSAASLFASASLTETFGLTFAEAMQFGLPIVAMNSLAAPEIVGEAGIIVNNKNELREWVEKLLKEDKLREELGKRAKRRSREFSLENHIKKLEEIYNKVVESTL